MSIEERRWMHIFSGLYTMLWKKCVSENERGLTTVTTEALSHTPPYTQAQPRPQSAAATHPITIKFCAWCSSGPGYRWFILRFIKETGVPLKRDQSATRLEESASNWPFIKKPSQVDRSAEISRMTTEPHYINYTTDEPHALQLAPCDSRESGKHTHTHLDTCSYAAEEEKKKKRKLMVFINVIWCWDKLEQTFPLLLYF